MDDDTERRITALETKLSFLEDFVNRLQQEVVDRAGTMDRLVAEQKAAREKLVELMETMEYIPDRRPPHY